MNAPLCNISHINNSWTRLIPHYEKIKQVLTDTAAVKCYGSWALLLDSSEVDEPAEHDDKHTVRHVVFQNVNFFF